MLYTFTVTESQLRRITDILHTHYAAGSHQYVLAVQHRITDDLVTVMVECTEQTAVFIRLLL